MDICAAGVVTVRTDKSVCIVIGSAVLTLASLSFVFCPTAHAGGPAKSAVAASAPADDDGDGDELLEHWNNPAYAGEERRQLAGLTLLLTGAGITAARRRQKMRRARL